MSTAYSSLKILHHPAHIDALQSGELIGPIHVQFIPTNRCPQNCTFCAYRDPTYPTSQLFNPRSQIAFPKLVELVGDCRRLGVQAIQLTGGGEPTWHPQFVELCDCILDAEIDLALVTNGMGWSDDHLRVLSQASWVRFSLDAGTAATYARVHGTRAGLFHDIRQYIKDLASARIDNEPTIGVGFVVFRDNWREVVQATQNARDDGANNIRLSGLFQSDGLSYFESFGKEAAELCRRAELLRTNGFAVFNRYEDRLFDLQQQSPDYGFCGYMHLTTYLGADLELYTCCLNAYNLRGKLGSLKNRGLYDLWTSAAFQQRLREYNARQCPRCMYNQQNQVINYLLEHNPQHVNFT